jgi:hypothetical protein
MMVYLEDLANTENDEIFTGNPLQNLKKHNKNKFLNTNLNFVREQQKSRKFRGQH